MQNILNKHIIKIFLLIALLFSANACRKVTIHLEKLPANTPPGAKIYIAGNFNFWDPGDERYILDYDKQQGYSITLPAAYGKMEYKFTRGDWSTVERDRCGNDINNRVLENFDVLEINNRIESWADLEPLECDSVIVILTKIPANTPKNAVIRIAGNFNAWNPVNDTLYAFKKEPKNNTYTIVLHKTKGMQLKDFQFKIIRDNISQVESDYFGNEIDSRKIDFSKGENIQLEVENWTDLADSSLRAVTIILKKIPKNTPESNQIYLTGNFNDWVPNDKNYIFRKNKKGLYAISIPRRKYGLSFKVTRGSWSTEAADNRGIEFNNQSYNYSEIDTIFFEIHNWKDIKPQWNDHIFIIEKLPANTPPNQDICLIGTFNDWNVKTKQYIFKKDENGKYKLRIDKTNDNFEYKITRGSWQSQELRENPRIAYPWDDTIKLSIKQWSDQINDKESMVRIEITRVPEVTPSNAKIHIAGGFNGWDPGDKDFILQKDPKGIYFIELPRAWLNQGFKFTRGSWSSVEANRKKRFLENRYYKGKDSVLKLTIEGWE